MGAQEKGSTRLPGTPSSPRWSGARGALPWGRVEQLVQGGLAQGPGSWKGQDGGFSGAGWEFRLAWGLGFSGL